MNTYRKNAIIVGVLFIACSAASIIGMSLASSLLDKPDYLTQLSTNENKAIIAAMIELIWAATGAGIAIGIRLSKNIMRAWLLAPLFSGVSRTWWLLSAHSACWDC
jgi:hypothetical protein